MFGVDQPGVCITNKSNVESETVSHTAVALSSEDEDEEPGIDMSAAANDERVAWWEWAEAELGCDAEALIP